MKETLKRIKADVILSAILCVALGVILMIWPTQVTKVLCYILAAILCVMGIGHIISYMRNKLESRLGLATGIAPQTADTKSSIPIAYIHSCIA